MLFAAVQTKDTVQIPVYVFTPNPIFSSGTNYGDVHSDQGDKMTEELRSQIQEVELEVVMENDRVLLSDSLIRLENISPPNDAVDGFQRGNIRPDRSLLSFESVSCVYHIRRFQHYIRQLGFGHHLRPVRVDPRALSGADRSRFSSGTDPPTIEFGIGGVDDAEDAQVIIHEYTHSVLFQPTYKSQSFHVLEEAVCDHFCLRYSELLAGRIDDRVFSWDGHNEFWNGYTSQPHAIQIDDRACDEICQREKWLYFFASLREDLFPQELDELLLHFISRVQRNRSTKELATQLIESALKTHDLNLKKYLIRHGILAFPKQNLKKIYVIGGELHLNALEYFNSAEILSPNGTLLSSYSLNGTNAFQIKTPHPGYFLLRLRSDMYAARKEEWCYLIVL